MRNIDYESFKKALESYVAIVNALCIMLENKVNTLNDQRENVLKKLNYIEKDKILEICKDSTPIKSARDYIKRKFEDATFNSDNQNVVVVINGIRFGIKIDNSNINKDPQSNCYFNYFGTDLNISIREDECWEIKKDNELQYKQLKKLIITLNNKKIDNSPELEIMNNLFNASERATEDFMKFINDYVEKIDNYMVEKCIELLKYKKNLIIQGAPGTGKTFITDKLIKELTGLDKNNKGEWQETGNVSKRIAFCTFHQTMDYDDFVLGLKPSMVKDDEGKTIGIEYKPIPGIFKEIADEAKDIFNKHFNNNKEKKDEEKLLSLLNDKSKACVLVIDEINRGNISKIFGELITLLENGKRLGSNQPLYATLPYTNEKWALPPNLYIIGTMNTTDRSMGNIDYAIRRRFAFITLKAEENIVSEYYDDKDPVLRKMACELFKNINLDIESNRADNDMDIEDLKIGNSYFMAENIDILKIKLEYEIIPLIEEYIKDGLLKMEIKEQFDKWKKNIK